MVNIPIVSVVIACHNYGKWLGKALQSAADQDYPAKQIILIDDNSTDNSWNIAKLYCNLRELNPDNTADLRLLPKQNVALTGRIGTTPVIAYRFNDNGGPSRARNLAIKLGWNNTHLYAVLDADDEFKQGKISKSVTKFLEDPNHIGAVYTDYDTINEETGVMLREFKEPFSRERLMNECIVHSACMFSRLAIEQCGGYDEQLRCCEDYDLWLRLSEKFMIVHVPEPLMLVRVGSHSSTSTVQQDIWNKCYARVFEKLQERMKNA